MNQHPVLWTQKANSKAISFKNFGNFLYEFISGRLTILAFIALFSFLTADIKYYSYFLTAGIAYFLFLIISDSYKVFWNGINLQYKIKATGIAYEWGIFKRTELDIPFDDISKIFVLFDVNEKRRSIIFENKKGYRNGDYGFSKELYYNELSFENVSDLDLAVNALEKSTDVVIHSITNHKTKPWQENLAGSSLYLKFLQLLAFVFLYLATSTGLKIIDTIHLESVYVKDQVVSQQFRVRDEAYYHSNLVTSKGHRFNISQHFKYKGEEVEYHVSPIYQITTKFLSYKNKTQEKLLTKYSGINLLFKILAIFFLTLSALNFFRKKTAIPFEYLPLFIFFPLLFLFVSNYGFN